MSSYWLLIQQPDQPPIIFANIYYPSGLAKQTKEDTVSHIVFAIAKQLQKYSTAKLFICGDFNDVVTAALSTLFPIQTW